MNKWKKEWVTLLKWSLCWNVVQWPSGGYNDFFTYVKCLQPRKTLSYALSHVMIIEMEAKIKAFPNIRLSRHFTTTGRHRFALLFLDKCTFYKCTKKYLKGRGIRPSKQFHKFAFQIGEKKTLTNFWVNRHFFFSLQKHCFLVVFLELTPSAAD